MNDLSYLRREMYSSLLDYEIWTEKGNTCDSGFSDVQNQIEYHAQRVARCLLKIHELTQSN